MSKLLYTRREVAAMIGLSHASVEALTQSGQLPSIKVGRAVRISASALEAFCATGTANKTVDGRPLDPLWRSKGAR